MSIRNEISVAGYDFVDQMIGFRIKLDSDVFANKLWDLDVIDDSMQILSDEDDDGTSYAQIWGSVESFGNMVCQGKPYKDAEIEEFIDAISVMLEQLPRTFKNLAELIEENK